MFRARKFGERYTQDFFPYLIVVHKKRAFQTRPAHLPNLKQKISEEIHVNVTGLVTSCKWQPLAFQLILFGELLIQSSRQSYFKQDRKYMYNVTFRGVRIIIVVMEKQ